MKKAPVRKSAPSSKKHSKKRHIDLRRGKLGAGMAYVIFALMILGFFGVSMIGNIVPIGRDATGGVPVVLEEFKSTGVKNNLQLETFKGTIVKPTHTQAPPFEDPKSDSPGDGDRDKDDGGDGDGDGGGNSCFPKGTKIFMSDGSRKNIEDVKVGDKIMGFDGEKQVAETVLEVESPLRDHLYTLQFSDGTTLQLTREHPLFTEKGWKSISPDETAEENPRLAVEVLRVGDKVLNSQGKYVTIASIKYVPGKVQTYNLKAVSGYNNFFAGEKLAHNKNGGGDGGGGDSGGGSGSSGCFVKGTKIIMADGAQKNIEDVRPGERVMSYDGKGMSQETVTAIQSPISDHHYKVRLADGTVLGVTDNHAIYTRNGWKAINPANAQKENPNLAVTKFAVGAEVLNSKGSYVRVVDMKFIPGNVQTYNLKGITNYNTYYANGLVVHNKR